MIYTENYGLNKPEDNDVYSIEHQNNNMDAIENSINNLTINNFQNRGSANKLNIDKLFSDSHQGTYVVQVSETNGTQAFTSEDYELIVMANLQMAISYTSCIFKIRIYVNNIWTDWVQYQPITE